MPIKVLINIIARTLSTIDIAIEIIFNLFLKLEDTSGLAGESTGAYLLTRNIHIMHSIISIALNVGCFPQIINN
jgi:hypothetical protein